MPMSRRSPTRNDRHPGRASRRRQRLPMRHRSGRGRRQRRFEQFTPAFARSSSSQTISPTGTATTLTSSVSADGLRVCSRPAGHSASGATIAGTVGDFLDTTTNTDLTPGGIALVNGVSHWLCTVGDRSRQARTSWRSTREQQQPGYRQQAPRKRSAPTPSETPFDVMASPDSVGSTLLDAAGRQRADLSGRMPATTSPWRSTTPVPCSRSRICQQKAPGAAGIGRLLPLTLRSWVRVPISRSTRNMF